MFRYDVRRKKIVYFKRRIPRGYPEYRFDRVKRGLYKGTNDTRPSRCFRQRCRDLKQPLCSWCRSLSYVPTQLQKERCKSRNLLNIANKLGFLMAELQSAQSDSYYDCSNIETVLVLPLIVKCSTYSPPTIVRAKKQLSKWTSRLWSDKRPQSEKMPCGLVRSRDVPRRRRDRRATVSCPAFLEEPHISLKPDACTV